MVLAAVIAIFLANSPWHETYFGILETHLLVELGPFHLEESLLHLVNDGLMVIFFYVVGLEIKRELVLGELRDPKTAALPVMAALGGMVLPALIYLAIAGGVPGAARGWGIPVATDIAFSLGVLSLLGRRVPATAKLFLLTLAIVDDLGGILIIALFYTDDLSVGWLGVGLAALALVGVASRVGIRSHVFYLPAALVAWFGFLESGVHATIAGVALAFLTPARPMYGAEELDRRARRILDLFPTQEETAEQREKVEHEAMLLAEIARESVAPLTRNEHRLQPWSSYVVIPIFALANAGVRFEQGIVEPLLTPIALGVAAGLLVGKTVGISAFTWGAVRLGWGRLPSGVGWRQLTGVAATAGIGFTVSLFITALAFTDPALAADAKVGIFAGSLASALLGVAILAGSRPAPVPAQEPEPAMETL
jgi:NhaA family Na+:H+ antiporter